MVSKSSRDAGISRVIALILFLGVFEGGCSSGSNKPGQNPTTQNQTNQIGSTVNQSPATWRFFTANGETTFYGFDRYSKRINLVRKNADSIQQSAVLSVPAQQDSWFAGRDGKVFFTIEDKKLLTLNVNSQGTQSDNKTLVKTFAGTIKSVAADNAQGIYAFTDEYLAITLLTMNQEGVVDRQWTGGPLLSDGSVITAGDIIAGGQMVAVASNSKILVVNVSESIASQSWSTKTYTLDGLTDLNWVAPVQGRSDRVFVATPKAVALVATDTGAIVEKLDVVSGFSSQKSGKPHIRYFDVPTNQWRIVTPGGGDALQKINLPNNDKFNLSTDVEQLFLTDAYVNLVMSKSSSASRRVLTLRLSDALIERSVDILASTVVGLGSDEFSAMEASALGATTVYSLRQDVSKSFRGYNRATLQGN